MMKRAVFNAVGKVMGNENLGKVSYHNESAFGKNENQQYRAAHIGAQRLIRAWHT